MNKRLRIALLASCALLSLASPLRGESAPPPHLFFNVALAKSFTQPVSGRLIVFMERADLAKTEASDGKITRVDVSPFFPKSVSISAKEITALAPGDTVSIDTDDLAFPSGFSHLPDGEYVAQALLDVGHTYNYLGRAAGDIVSEVATIHKAGNALTTAPLFTLSSTVPARDPWQFGANAPKSLEQAGAAIKPLDFTSPVLSGFWGRPIHVRGWVVLPPDYDKHTEEHYPTVYFTHGFGGNLDRLTRTAVSIYDDMRDKKTPPMIWVLLDESSPTGTHEFADSANNGPWGRALTSEVIPTLESQYRMDAKAGGRFLTGHSSGGWATLWLQTRYPKIFGGTWSTSPDPSDFHDFTGVDLYAPNANMFHRADGTLFPLVRDKGQVIATGEDFERMERVLGSYGGQMASFEWVFSPRAPDGTPMQMFSRDTGNVDPEVIAYWRDHYDIAHRLQTNWSELQPDLDGKIHVIVGTADTFYLDGAAHKLQAVLDGLHAKSSFRYIEGRTHMDLYRVGDDPGGLAKTIAWEMYAVARPGSALHPQDHPLDK